VISQFFDDADSVDRFFAGVMENMKPDQARIQLPVVERGSSVCGFGSTFSITFFDNEMLDSTAAGVNGLARLRRRHGATPEDLFPGQTVPRMV
jgi:hypothetical protein